MYADKTRPKLWVRLFLFAAPRMLKEMPVQRSLLRHFFAILFSTGGELSEATMANAPRKSRREGQ